MKEFDVVLKVKLTRCVFDDDESNKNTVRYLVEQDLLDNGWDAEVEVLEEE